jgi:hypothetical protein
MAKSKLANPQDRSNSNYQKQIDRSNKFCTELQKTSRLRKAQMEQYRTFVAALIEEGRVTKQELVAYFPKLKR